MTEPSLTEDPFAATTDTVFRLLGTSTNGLTNDQAQERLTRFGANRLRSKERATGPMLLLRQFTSPIILILIGAAVLSIFLQDVTDAVIILVIVIVSGLLGFWQEHRAATAVASLCAVVETKVRVLRAGVEVLVPGDLVLLSAGAIIPADCRLLEARDLFVSEATLTGETYPGEKTPGALSANTALARRSNAVFMGTHVVSGSGKACVIHCGDFSGAVSAIRAIARLRADAGTFLPDYRADCGRVHGCGGSNEAPVLPRKRLLREIIWLVLTKPLELLMWARPDKPRIRGK